MKAVIAGGLGYIGCGLIESYRHETDTEIILIDKQFFPERLAGLPSHFKYIQADILDSATIRPLLKNADVAYLLAAEVEAEKSKDRVESIWKNNYGASLDFINCCPDETRIIFASTGNVFGGVDESQKYMNLTEEDEPRPKYPYAETKRAVEKYLLGSKKNFTICRFGTNYGFTPGIRFNLVTNNFIKKVMMGENLIIHGSGENYRPTCPVHDAVRAMRFLAGRAETAGEIYHVVEENYTIKNLAELTALYNPNVSITNIIKEVPFSSYHLSNNKIKGLGFNFEWNLDRAVKELFDIFQCLRTNR